MTFGLTTSGFVSKRIADIQTEIENALKSELGNSINLLPSSVLGQLVGIFSERESELWELSEAVYSSQYPATAEGLTLDNVVSLTGLTRQPGTRSTVDLILKGTAGTVIPSGSVFSVVNDSPSRFVLGTDLTLIAGIDEVQTLTFGAVPDAGSFRLSLNSEDTTLLTFNSLATDVENALNALSSLSSVLVAGDFLTGFVITFQGADGSEDKPLLSVVENTLTETATPVTTNLVETTKGVSSGQVTLEAEEIGANVAPARALTVIENPISGLDAVLNPSDALIGSDIEDDASLKQRRENSLQRAGAGTLGSILSTLADLDGVNAVVGFENITFIEVDGRPPKSFEMVVQGGDVNEIAETIFAIKPAGIETFGSVTQQITDSQGFFQDVKFSRPTGIQIFVEIDLSVDANYPANGDDQVQAAIVAFGNGLGIGADVIVFPKLICSIDSIPGITDVEIRVGTSAGPTLSDNIDIDAAEISEWDTSRVLVGRI
jgi:uncharacterized phage protein gp47/JayE